MNLESMLRKAFDAPPRLDGFDHLAHGDLLNKVKHYYPYAVYCDFRRRMADGLGYEEKTLECWRWCASKVAKGVRAQPLSYQHHEKVATRPRHLQARFLKLAAREKWSVRRLDREIKCLYPVPAQEPTALERFPPSAAS